MDIFPGLPTDIGFECLIQIHYLDFPSVKSVCTSWSRLIELPEFWNQRKALGFTRKVVVMVQRRIDWSQRFPERFCGLTVFEPETGYRAVLPSPLPFGLPLYCQLVAVGYNIVVMGGLNPLTKKVMNDVFVYNFVSGTWRRGADIPGQKRERFACASDSNRTVFVAGGIGGDEKCTLTSARSYDVIEDKWTDLPDMAIGCEQPKGLFCHGKFYVIGRSRAEAFDVATWQWETLGNKGICYTDTNDRYCAADDDGKLFMSHGDYVRAIQGSESQTVAKLPSGMGYIKYMTTWPEKLLLIGCGSNGEPYKSFTLDLKSLMWEDGKDVEILGYVEAACCLEL